MNVVAIVFILCTFIIVFVVDVVFIRLNAGESVVCIYAIVFVQMILPAEPSSVKCRPLAEITYDTRTQYLILCRVSVLSYAKMCLFLLIQQL